MGDCRVRFLISNHALRAAQYISNDGEDFGRSRFYEVNKIYSADTTLREIMEEKIHICDDDVVDVEITILSLLEVHACSLWDCTIHPAVEITDWPLKIFKEKQGPKVSKTIFDMGWYPSATLQVLAKDEPYRQSRVSEDITSWNVAKSDDDQPLNQIKPRVLLMQNQFVTESGLPLPSQIMESVVHRFAAETVETETRESDQARKLRQINKQAAIEKEQIRFRKLEERILKVKAACKNNKNQKVSEQVQRMLFKSRATGRKDLRPEDRLYLRCFISIVEDGAIDEERVEEDYRFFSYQDSAGSILKSFDCKKSSSCRLNNSEVLVKCKQSDNGENHTFRRLPTLMRLYEAISAGVIQDFDEVVIRFFDSEKQEMTTCITDTFKINNIDVAVVADVKILHTKRDDENAETSAEVETKLIQSPSADTGPTQTEDESDTLSTIKRLTDAIHVMDEKDQKSKKGKKSSAAAIKVFQMQMKSKAVGDAKRVKMSDRFFFELVTIVDHNSAEQCVAASTFCFLAYSDPISRIIRDCCSKNLTNNTSMSWEVYLPVMSDNESSSETTTYRKILNTGISFQDADQQKLLKCFQRIILRSS